MFVMAVCVLFRIKLRWSKEKNVCNLIIAGLLSINKKRGIVDILIVFNDHNKTQSKLTSFYFGITYDGINRTITRSLLKRAEKFFFTYFYLENFLKHED